MSNFKEYASTRKQSNQNGENQKQEIPKNAFEMLKNIASTYEGASKQDLISAIISEATKSRKNGTLTDAEIENFVKTISPMLNASQKTMLDGVIKTIKNS